LCHRGNGGGRSDDAGKGAAGFVDELEAGTKVRHGRGCVLMGYKMRREGFKRMGSGGCIAGGVMTMGMRMRID